MQRQKKSQNLKIAQSAISLKEISKSLNQKSLKK